MCDWCEGGACDLVYSDEDYTVSGEIDAETGIMEFTANGIHGGRRVRFCPMCGRRVGAVSKIDKFYDALNEMIPGFRDFREVKDTIAWNICKNKAGVSYMDDDKLLSELEVEYWL